MEAETEVLYLNSAHEIMEASFVSSPFEMKLVAEAISEFTKKHYINNESLDDFRLKLQQAYQSHHNLHENDFGFIEEDRQEVYGAF